MAMAQPDFFSAFQKSEFTIINRVFFQKLERSKKYIYHRVERDEKHSFLIQDLDCLISEAVSYQIRATIVGRRIDFTEQVKLASQACEVLNPGSNFKNVTMAGAI